MDNKKNAIFVRSSCIYDDSRATKEIINLLENNYNVIVLGWNRDGKALSEANKVFEKFDNITIKMYNVDASNGIGLKNINKLFKWFKWIKQQLNFIKNIDFIHACDLDTGLVVQKYCKKHNIKYIYDIYDYYVDTHNIPFFLNSFVEKKEIKVIDNANVTIICTEERIEQISKSNPKRIEYIYNAPDSSSINLDNNNELKYDYVYCGGLSEKRLINQILKEYPNNTDLKFVFAGSGTKEIVDYAIELDKKYDNFTFLGTIPYSKVIEYESKARCLSAIYNPIYRNHKLCAPNKFYESLALGKPIIVCNNTGIDVIVNKYKLGMSIDFDVHEFYSSVRRIINDEQIIYNCEKQGKSIFLEKYDWKIMKIKLSKIYKEL